MKYADMQAAAQRNRDAHAKAREVKRAARELAGVPECPKVPAGERKETPPPNSHPGETLPLLVNLEGETWLANRLLQHGINIYDGGPYERYADRLGAAIVRNGIAAVVVGRHEGKPSTYAETFERIAGKPLPSTAKSTTKAGS